MRIMTIATAALFLIATLTMNMWPAQSTAQEDNPFGKQSAQGQDTDPFAPDGKQSSKKTPPTKAKAKVRAPARTRPAQPIGPQPSARTVSNNRIRATLSKPADLIYDAEPFGDVRAQLSQDLKLNIVVDPNLEGVLDDDTEVTTNLSGVRLSDGLREMLRTLDATYLVRDGMLLIISIDDEYEPGFEVRQMIDVNEALRFIQTLESDRIGKPYKPVVVQQGLSGGKGGGAIAAPKEKVSMDKAELPILTTEQLLIDTIVKVVESDAWEINGGGNATLTCVGGVLFVQSPEKIAEAVRDLVEDFEYQINSRN